MYKWKALRLMLDEGRYSIDEDGNVWSHYEGRTRLKATRIKRGYREIKLRHKKARQMYKEKGYCAQYCIDKFGACLLLYFISFINR